MKTLGLEVHVYCWLLGFSLPFILSHLAWILWENAVELSLETSRGRCCAPMSRATSRGMIDNLRVYGASLGPWLRPDMSHGPNSLSGNYTVTR